jgi:hypothetical protein
MTWEFFTEIEQYIVRKNKCINIMNTILKVLLNSNYCTWTRSIRGFMVWSKVQQYWTRRRRVQYCCTLLHKTSYWSSSSVVFVLLHKALFYYNFWNFLKILSFWIFLKSYEIFESLEILWKFEIKIFFLWNFLTYWLAKSNFCAIKNHITLSCHVILFIDFAQECNMIIYCTEIAFC